MNNIKLFETIEDYSEFAHTEYELPLVTYIEDEKNLIFKKAPDQDKQTQDIIIGMYELVNHPYIHVNT